MSVLVIFKKSFTGSTSPAQRVGSVMATSLAHFLSLYVTQSPFTLVHKNYSKRYLMDG